MVKLFKRFFGFTSRGGSILGRVAREKFLRREIQRGVGIFLVAIATATFLTRSLSNIGGATLLAIDLSGNTPKPTIDASTVYTAQTPVAYQSESRGFSWFHSGADLAAPIGTPVRPIMQGIVKTAISEPYGYGKHVIVTHQSGYESIYGHLSKIDVAEGEVVTLATKLGEVGSTGFSTGPHLHLEVHQNGTVINPADIVPGVK